MDAIELETEQIAKECRAYSKLPNAVCHDNRLDADALGLLAYRASFIGNFSLNAKHIKKMLRMGNHRFYGAVKTLTSTSYLTRRQASDGTARHRRIVETLNLGDPSGGYVFAFRNELEALDTRAVGVFCFVAARPFGQHVFSREVADRFDWTPATVAKWLKALIECGMIVREIRRDNTGRHVGTVYCAPLPQNMRDQEENPHTTFPHTSFSVDTAAARDPEPASGDGGVRSWLKRLGDGNPRADRWREAIACAEHQIAPCGDVECDHLRRQLHHITDGRISRKLLTPTALHGFQVVVAAIARVAELELKDAHDFCCQYIMDRSRKQKHFALNSWGIVALNLAREINER